MRMEIATRTYNSLKKVSHKPEHYSQMEQAKPSYDRILVLDTETRSDEKQALTFGSYAIMRGSTVEELGLFYNTRIVSDDELRILQNYCKRDQIIKLYTLEEFNELVFYPNVYTDQIPCTAYNMSFDLSRIATDYAYAKKKMKGGFTFKLSDKKKLPPIRVKHLNTAEQLIEFQNTKYSRFKGNFIDCQTLTMIMMDRKHVSLSAACERYNKIHKKLHVSEHGKITREYLDYNIEDTLSTAELFRTLKNEYERFEVDLPLTKVFSSASIGKAFLEKLGIKPFIELSPDFPPEIYGKIMQAYFGGRCEDRIRKTPVRVTALDFTSMYPSLFILLGLYDFLIAERLEFKDDTEQVKKFVDGINSIEDLRNPDVWKKLNVIVEILPDDDLLPVRARYDENTFTVGLNYLSSKETLYYGLPSVIHSKLRTGKTPNIKSAISFNPVGRQNTLKKAKLLGMEMDPLKDNVFKFLVEEKQRSKIAKDGRDRQIKILVNATSYGIYIQLDLEDKESEVIVYGGNASFPDFKRFEKPGRYFNPIISTIITDGAKLLLGICECILEKHGEVMAYSDTDSTYVPPMYAKEIIEFFDPLNPYNNIDHLLKIEENDIWFYGISAKRYVLYNMNEQGDFRIEDENGDENYSLHGLGHLLNPFGKVNHWQKEIWLDILRLHYDKLSVDDLLNKYRGYYAISQFTVSTASLMKRFTRLNARHDYDSMIKPFNFLLVGFGNTEDVKPIASFSKNPQSMPYSPFVNYRDGKIMAGQKYFKTLADELWSYINHPESKLDGDIGIMQRKHVRVDNIAYIGKEADKIEDNISGLEKLAYNIYYNPKNLETIFSWTWNEVKQCGIPESQFYALKKQLKEGKRLKLSSKTSKRLKSICKQEVIKRIGASTGEKVAG